MEDMNIHELVSVLRTAFMTEDFDRVEDGSVGRYNGLQTDIIDLQDLFIGLKFCAHLLILP
jgi:hypothetical protein